MSTGKVVIGTLAGLAMGTKKTKSTTSFQYGKQLKEKSTNAPMKSSQLMKS